MGSIGARLVMPPRLVWVVSLIAWLNPSLWSMALASTTPCSLGGLHRAGPAYIPVSSALVSRSTWVPKTPCGPRHAGCRRSGRIDPSANSGWSTPGGWVTSTFNPSGPPSLLGLALGLAHVVGGWITSMPTFSAAALLIGVPHRRGHPGVHHPFGVDLHLYRIALHSIGIAFILLLPHSPTYSVGGGPPLVSNHDRSGGLYGIGVVGGSIGVLGVGRVAPVSIGGSDRCSQDCSA